MQKQKQIYSSSQYFAKFQGLKTTLKQNASVKETIVEARLKNIIKSFLFDKLFKLDIYKKLCKVAAI